MMNTSCNMFIKDFLSWELLMSKKCSQYAAQEVDPMFRGAFEQAGQTHQQNYLNLVNYLEQVKNSQKGMMN